MGCVSLKNSLNQCQIKAKTISSKVTLAMDVYELSLNRSRNRALKSAVFNIDKL